jgi:hypothetical protein
MPAIGLAGGETRWRVMTASDALQRTAPANRSP